MPSSDWLNLNILAPELIVHVEIYQSCITASASKKILYYPKFEKVRRQKREPRSHYSPHTPGQIFICLLIVLFKPIKHGLTIAIKIHVESLSCMLLWCSTGGMAKAPIACSTPCILQLSWTAHAATMDNVSRSLAFVRILLHHTGGRWGTLV